MSTVEAPCSQTPEWYGLPAGAAARSVRDLSFQGIWHQLGSVKPIKEIIHVNKSASDP